MGGLLGADVGSVGEVLQAEGAGTENLISSYAKLSKLCW